jgi:DNA polymerase III delta subunit
MTSRAPVSRPAPAGKSPVYDAPAYLLLAPDNYLLEEEERALAGALIPPEARQMSMMAVHGEEADPGEIVDFLQAYSFFGGRKLLVIRGIEKMDDWKDLLPYLADPNPASCLVMTSTASLKGRDHKARLGALAARAKVIERKRPGGAGLAEWVRKRYAAAGKRVDDRVVHALVEAAGSDLATLAAEVEKTALYAGEDETVAPAHLEAVLAGGEEGNIFAFLDAVGERDLPGALRLGRALTTADARPDYLVHMLARLLRQLVRGKGLMRQGMSAIHAARELGMSWDFQQKKFAVQLSRWAEPDLLSALDRMSAGDLAVKRSRLPAEVLVDSLLMRLLAR